MPTAAPRLPEKGALGLGLGWKLLDCESFDVPKEAVPY